MTDERSTALQYAHDHKQLFLDELQAFCRIASISTDPTARPEMQHAAEWVAGQLASLGVKNIQIFPTAGHPVVYGEMLEAGPSAPTALLYGHYDVQPADPLELWVSGPFEPTIRGDNIYARGVTDMKGQVMIALKAIQAIR
jgi:acetylornithine deacetylase/succinyl-diaminopimelate desuccinylase-like protein